MFCLIFSLISTPAPAKSPNIQVTIPPAKPGVWKAPDGTLQQFLSGENRYALLEKQFPEESKRLRQKIEKEYNERYNIYKHMAETASESEEEKE